MSKKAVYACATCDSLVERFPSGVHGAVYCGRECMYAARAKNPLVVCGTCGASFRKQSPARASRYCSRECYRNQPQEQTPSWRGGVSIAKQHNPKLTAALGHKRRKFVHRISAERVLGRILGKDEYVIPLDRNYLNPAPDNLFVCASKAELKRREQGSLPWPVASNLEALRSVAGPAVATISWDNASVCGEPV